MTDSLRNIPLFSWELGLIEYMWQFCLSMAKANSADALKAYATVIDHELSSCFKEPKFDTIF